MNPRAERGPTLLERGPRTVSMATAKTSSFWLTETVELTAVDTLVQGTIDLGAYVDISSSTSIAIQEIDWIVQARDTAANTFSNSLPGAATGNTQFDFQLMDLNPGTAFLRADDNTLIGSGGVYLDDGNSIISIGPDLFPDNFQAGSKLANARFVVNDSLYVVGAFHGAALAANRSYVITVRIKAVIAKLKLSDYVALAVQSTASDN